MPFQELHKPSVLPIRKDRRHATMAQESCSLMLHVGALVEQR